MCLAPLLEAFFTGSLGSAPVAAVSVERAAQPSEDQCDHQPHSRPEAHPSQAAATTRTRRSCPVGGGGSVAPRGEFSDGLTALLGGSPVGCFRDDSPARSAGARGKSHKCLTSPRAACDGSRPAWRGNATRPYGGSMSGAATDDGAVGAPA